METADQQRAPQPTPEPARARCPDCDAPLHAQSGCLTCSACGWSRCAS